MKAIRIHQHGGPDVLKIDDVEKPIVQDDEVLIKLKTAALNHLDIWVRKGIPGVILPMISGSDAAGMVVETGRKVKQFRAGDDVVAAPVRSCGNCDICRSGKENMCRDFRITGENTQGVMAEYISLPERYIYKKPENLSWEESAAFPLAAITAYHMLYSKADLKKDEWILIYGASSGVGSAAIQFARQTGARVITTAGTEAKAKLARKLGADYVINYRKQPIGRTVREITSGMGVDVVFEHTGAKTWHETLRSLKFGGKIVTCGATTGPIVNIDLRAVFIKHQQIIGSTLGTLNDMREILELIVKGHYKPAVDKVFSYREIKEAHQWLEEGNQFGKVVIRFDAD